MDEEKAKWVRCEADCKRYFDGSCPMVRRVSRAYKCDFFVSLNGED